MNIKLLHVLFQGKVSLFKVDGELVYRLTDQQATKYKGTDNEERVVLKIIEESGNKGIWARDIRTKSNLNQSTLTKVLKSLEGKKLIKSVSSVSVSSIQFPSCLKQVNMNLCRLQRRKFTCFST